MFLMFGVKMFSESSSKIIPLLDNIFSPDISVLNQKIVRSVYPQATINFLVEAFNNNNLSEIKIFPSSYINNESAPVIIDPLLQFLADSNIASNVKYKPASGLFGDVIFNEIQDIMNSGFKEIKKSNQFETSFKHRTVKLNSKSSKIIVGQISLKLYMNQSMYISLFDDPDDPDETLLDLIMQKMIYFKTTELSKLQLAYRFKIGILDVETQEFQSLMSYKPIELPISLNKKADTRILQVPINQFIVNLFDKGVTIMSDKVSKQILINRKQVKMKVWLILKQLIKYIKGLVWLDLEKLRWMLK